jgi:hypothetical protein
VTIPAVIVEFDRSAVLNGARLDDPITAALDSAVLEYIAPTFAEDISEFVREVSVQRGTQRELQKVEAGTATVVLDNRDGRFTPFDVSSPYYPDVLPMRRMRIFAGPPPSAAHLFGDDGFGEGLFGGGGGEGWGA